MYDAMIKKVKEKCVFFADAQSTCVSNEHASDKKADASKVQWNNSH